ncbi:DUF1272 domain-containing protein [Paraburkholderia sp. DHOC27]|uniref:DUF1272 domain-containing protein n=1 Tax=Paraburkholderia sp. DHOC27 TaxID=2303330 RepID=UPI000E3BB994|nr:DUF1272 domain-containing protein [Paraburkholderia sp. DHOC27]RFU48668.1 DUF1272 domain-containing protein [Paraburkholderia sp. DHOC27]
MLELRPSCEACTKPLPANSSEAMICTYECTFCEDCALHVLRNVCPNCGGNFERRPIRPRAMLAKHPARHEPFHAEIDQTEHSVLVERYGATLPADR